MKNEKIMNIGMINSIEQLEFGTLTDKLIEIKSIYKGGKTTVQPVRDPLSGWYKGVQRLSENDKRSLNVWADPDTKFTLKEGVVLDLNKEEHRVIWNWVKFQPCLAMSYDECQQRPEAEFYVHLQHKEALESVSRKKLKFQAMKYITEDNSSNYPLRVKLLGINMDGEDPVVIEDFLLERADVEPERIIKLYVDKFLSLRMLLINAIAKRKVIIEPSGAYRYGNMFLGMTEESALDWLSSPENKSVQRLLEEEVNPEYFKEVEPEAPIYDAPEYEPVIAPIQKPVVEAPIAKVAPKPVAKAPIKKK
jgi:hypothetical protein